LKKKGEEKEKEEEDPKTEQSDIDGKLSYCGPKKNNRVPTGTVLFTL